MHGPHRGVASQSLAGTRDPSNTVPGVDPEVNLGDGLGELTVDGKFNVRVTKPTSVYTVDWGHYLASPPPGTIRSYNRVLEKIWGLSRDSSPDVGTSSLPPTSVTPPVGGQGKPKETRHPVRVVPSGVRVPPEGRPTRTSSRVTQSNRVSEPPEPNRVQPPPPPVCIQCQWFGPGDFPETDNSRRCQEAPPGTSSLVPPTR